MRYYIILAAFMLSIFFVFVGIYAQPQGVPLRIQDEHSGTIIEWQWYVIAALLLFAMWMIKGYKADREDTVKKVAADLENVKNDIAYLKGVKDGEEKNNIHTD